MKQQLLALLAIATIPFLIAWLVPDEHVRRREMFRAMITEMSSSVRARSSALDETCTAAGSSAELSDIRRSCEDLRKAYKSLEPLAEYLDPGSISMYVNGAPLRALSAELRTSLDAITGMMHTAPWTDRMILEACRSGVMRITTMGITGFDRPASEPVLTDDLPCLETIKRLTMLYAPALAERGKGALQKEAARYIDNAEQVIKTSSFDDVDRAELIRTSLDPLYGQIAKIQLALEIELSTEIGLSQTIVHPTANSMFATDVLYPSASSGISRASITPYLVELGRTLFFDPILSSNGERACASCHDPSRGFSDGRTTSIALGRTGSLDRNAPTLINAVHARRFFSDLRAMRVRDVIAHVVTNEKEFNSTLLEMVGRLRSSDEYVELFSKAFVTDGPHAVDATNVGIAIGAYLTTLVSFNSRFDRYLRGESVTISNSERRGFSLFTGRAACASCHFPPTYAGYVPPSFIDSESEIIGVPLHPDTAHAIPDPGMGRAAGLDRENATIYQGSFKTPTIRNIALTAPYFHNGSYSSLDDVVDFYARGGGRGIGLAVPFQTLPFETLQLTKRDRKDLIAFMKSLTDTVGLTHRPKRLPSSSISNMKKRTIGGGY